MESVQRHRKRLEEIGLDLETPIFKVYMRQYAQLRTAERTGGKVPCITCGENKEPKAKKS